MRLINDYQAKEFFMEITVSLSEMPGSTMLTTMTRFIYLECKINIHGHSGSTLVVRAFIPDASTIAIVPDDGNGRYEMQKADGVGFFETVISDRSDFFRYRLDVRTQQGNSFITYDPYSFPPVIPEYDLHLFSEGNNHKIYETFGANVREVNGIKGTLFAVWAPNARRVSVVGNFNNWDGRRHQMRCRGCSGVWELFIPGVTDGDIYKYEIKTPNGEIYIKSDPYAFYSELRPHTASVVYDLDNTYGMIMNGCLKGPAATYLKNPFPSTRSTWVHGQGCRKKATGSCHTGNSRKSW